MVIVPASRTRPTHADQQQDSGQSHERHCHAGVASCSDIPFTGASPFALLSDSLAYLGAFGALTALALLFWRPRSAASVDPESAAPEASSHPRLSGIAREASGVASSVPGDRAQVQMGRIFMARIPPRRVALAAALGALALAALAAAACGGGDNENAQTTAAIAAVTFFDSSGFHEIDDQLTQKGTLDPTAHSLAVHIQTVALATDWPKELQAGAKGLAQAMGDFAAAVDTDKPDLKKATELSNKAHASWHAFSTQVWDHLQEHAGLKVSSGSDAHSH